ncbi:hypothetical protein BZG36_04252 [Bifiguratus adelaidae]|uniref:Zn(2)-C6 fungal-type domain-containing protein n=1 Tax=Bifiguratus adelaidae TaxID=1938954 RepID=A0A261XWA0_9FUNG|nr:hypothetical protein BZG36_04252 [Bifiguratus adelaidae]
MDARVSSLSLEEPSSPAETGFVDGVGVGSATSSKDTSKRKRITQACDLCRKKRTKCDIDLAKLTCTTCTLAGVHCTFEKTHKKRGPPKGWQRQASGSENGPAMARQQSDPPNQVSHSREMHDGAMLPPSSVATPSPLSSSFPASSSSSKPSIETHDKLVLMTPDVARHLSKAYVLPDLVVQVPIVDEEAYMASLVEMAQAERPGILDCAVFIVACGHLAPNDTILASELSVSSLQLHDRIIGILPAFGSDLDSLRACRLLAHYDYLYSKGALLIQGVDLRQHALDIAFHLGLNHSPDPRQCSLRESELR